MLEYVIRFSLRNKFIVLLFTVAIVAYGIFALTQIPIGAVPDVTNNQVQVITTSRDLSTEDVEQFITYPVELEMANLPGVKEIRSISKFGLSVVTIVFDDDMGTYLPRQLIAEKIKSASANIPIGFGTPEMGPITTGLGEIYQYVLEVDPAYRHLYSTMDLRTIQDWIVKRQLSGIPGVVEVNTWGGFLKQYEVTLNPEKLRAMKISASDVYRALETNNSIAGGGYIEKEEEAYFIRGEGLVDEIPDIENIVVSNRGGLPIYIRDLANVGFGHATRFGAITGNGEGEKVLGQVMMLKDANSKAVIDAVKERVAEISGSLPEGVTINPFLERSALIGRTTSTIVENLVLGCLIVVLVVVVFLGNWRTGLVVASVIPLSLVFALSLMYVFGVDANLMSLGAIDFGIIIDGAVIIVEFIAFQLLRRRSELVGAEGHSRQIWIDEITYESTNKMMRSAVFGQLIIIIVFIPILSLADVEGKMFRPMALTFCFALIGAMILCFTYIPVVASLFLRPSDTDASKNLSLRFLAWLKSKYAPILGWVLHHRKTVIGLALALLVGTAYLFSNLGGEFVPTLDEGDFVIQPVLKTGTSLSRTVETTTEIERIIMTFPEVQQVVTRIGAAEVPTDPMSMEETDVIITLRNKSEWQRAASKDALADLIKEELTRQIPGVDYEFTQPIEMRFNELITGVRADLAIKIFGDNLSVLADKAAEIEQLIEGVPGAADIVVEKVEGLPQMQVVYDRANIARYGFNIQEVNDIISMGFAGKVAGSVFEGERRFDLVVRFDPRFRQDIQNLQNAYVTNSQGHQIPLSELAEISFTTGPAKISRDDTRRRVVVGVNVRNRDLESLVNDVEALIDANITLPPGYLVTYGGQFENLRSARERLYFAVPIALLLIFILLYFAFQSLGKALMVYTAIPLASVGGVLFLWLRGLPFSISAGVGFIALFGIAVLNGIVLIEHYKGLGDDYKNLRDLVIEGTAQRLRPVLLTATAAAMGFLPMAISTSAGAEVQRPLATVVIGGLITSTLLTLLVLPILYYTFEGRRLRPVKPKMAIALLALLLPLLGSAQPTPPLTLQDAIDLAWANNAGLNAQRLQVEQAEESVAMAFDVGPTNVFYHFDEANIAPNDEPLKVWGVAQTLRFPTAYFARKQAQQGLFEVEQQKLEVQRLLLEKSVTEQWLAITYRRELSALYQYLDSVYARFLTAASRRFEVGESNLLEKLTAESQRQQVSLQLNQSQKDIDQAMERLRSLLQSTGDFEIAVEPLARLPVQPPDTAAHVGIVYYTAMEQAAAAQIGANKSRLLPNLQLEYFQGTNNAENADTYHGVQFGLEIPLFFSAQRSDIRVAKLQQERVQQQRLDYYRRLASRRQELFIELEKYAEALEVYDASGAPLANSLIATGNRSFQTGEIDFFQYIQTVQRGIEIKLNYISTLQQYNRTALEINYIIPNIDY